MKVLMSHIDRKPDNQSVNINVNLNYPPITIQKLPKPIGKRLSEFSFNKEIFEKAIPYYNDALKKKLDSTSTCSNLDKERKIKRKKDSVLIIFLKNYSRVDQL